MASDGVLRLLLAEPRLERLTHAHESPARRAAGVTVDVAVAASTRALREAPRGASSRAPRAALESLCALELRGEENRFRPGSEDRVRVGGLRAREASASVRRSARARRPQRRRAARLVSRTRNPPTSARVGDGKRSARASKTPSAPRRERRGEDRRRVWVRDGRNRGSRSSANEPLPSSRSSERRAAARRPQRRRRPSARVATAVGRRSARVPGRSRNAPAPRAATRSPFCAGPRSAAGHASRCRLRPPAPREPPRRRRARTGAAASGAARIVARRRGGRRRRRAQARHGLAGVGHPRAKIAALHAWRLVAARAVARVRRRTSNEPSSSPFVSRRRAARRWSRRAPSKKVHRLRRLGS